MCLRGGLQGRTFLQGEPNCQRHIEPPRCPSIHRRLDPRQGLPRPAEGCSDLGDAFASGQTCLCGSSLGVGEARSWHCLQYTSIEVIAPHVTPNTVPANRPHRPVSAPPKRSPPRGNRTAGEDSIWRQGSAACPTTASLRSGRTDSAEGSVHARPLCKRWGFRCVARSTRALEADQEPHAETSRFPGKGEGKAVGPRATKPRLLACSAEAELLRPGLRVIGSGDLRHLRAVTCEHAHGQSVTESRRQTCKSLGGPSRRRLSLRSDKRSLGHLVQVARCPVVMLVRCQTGISANGRMVDLAHGHAGRSAGRQVVQTAARHSGAHAPCRSGKWSGGPPVKQATGQTYKQPNRRTARLFGRETRRKPRHAAPQQQASPNSLGNMKICGEAHNLRRNLFDDHTTICLLSAPVARQKYEPLQRVRSLSSRDHGC